MYFERIRRWLRRDVGDAKGVGDVKGTWDAKSVGDVESTRYAKSVGEVRVVRSSNKTGVLRFRGLRFRVLRFRRLCDVLRGVTLTELMGVMIVMGILLGIGMGVVGTNVAHSKITAAETVLDDFRAAFSNACISHPSVINDRKDAASAAGGYTTQGGLYKVVFNMNSVLDDKYNFQWDSSYNAYVSEGEDPWHGKYVLREYPIYGSYDFSDPLTCKSGMYLSIWCYGKSESVLIDGKVSDTDMGVLLRYVDGQLFVEYTGTMSFDNNSSILGAHW